MRKSASLSFSLYAFAAIGIYLLTTSVNTLEFAKSEDTAVVPVGFSTETAFYEAHVLVSVSGSVTDQLSRATFFRLNASSATPIALRPTTRGNGFQLYLQHALPHPTDGVADELVIVCANWTGSASTPCLNVTVAVLASGTDPCRSASALCFGSSASLDTAMTLTVPENSLVPQDVVRLHQPVYVEACGQLRRPSYNYTSLTGGTALALSVENQVLVLNERLNGDEFRNFTFELGCSVTIGDGVQRTLRKRVTVQVMNSNDHGPEPSESPRIIIDKIKEFTYKLLSVRDHDTRPSLYKVELYNDPLQLFSLAINRKHFLQGINAWLVTATVRPKGQLPLDFPANSYTIKVRFVDTTLKVATNLSNQVIYTLTFVKQGYAQPTNPLLLNDLSGNEFNATVSSNAAINSRVLQPIEPNTTFHAGVIFFLEHAWEQWTQPLPFNVTPSEGIIYVNDTDRLSIALDNGVHPIAFRLVWKARPSTDSDDQSSSLPLALGHLTIAIRLLPLPDGTVALQSDRNSTCVRSSSTEHNNGIMCSTFGSEKSCETSCAPGAATGQCRWRKPTLYRYGTCSPDLLTCPDKLCDELERTFYGICPQDCVESNNVHGAHFSSGQSHGIGNGHGTCTCDSFHKCSCDTSEISGQDTADVDDDHHGGRSSSAETIAKSPSGDKYEVKEDMCGTNCVVVTSLLGTLLAIAIACGCCVLVRRRRRKCVIQRGGHKYPNRDNSAPAVPSDYVVDERSSSSSASAAAAQNIIIMQDILSIANKNIQAIESEWEFPRYKLLLEQTLGEGEFGRVMRAKALDISGQFGYTTVAVKMSKCVGSSAEMDLLQEFNLLKEVVHPNVIRVLGACSSCKDGPLFIIVEYAEFGSLRVYLRKSRRFEFKSCTSDDSGVDDSLANGNGTLTAADHPSSDYQVNPRDLLQFAWQIAKGMAYLGEMKLVHRDLASRNILVAAGKVVKISDFGLTRDVYEGDTYFKKSTGRVPVKWMAIESLSDHVYTTKSDVWSFGIVLWEIITLGAAPYPGVPPETLYRLLKSGYRMEKPDNCSEELYDIMKKCWHEIPHERPSFNELTRKFDIMLQANVEYLDLGVNMVHNMAYFEDSTLTGQTETVDESEMGYGSWTALPTDDNDYLQSNSRPSNVDREEEVAFLLTNERTPTKARGDRGSTDDSPFGTNHHDSVV